ncbi:MAG: aromatic-ring-hydroxylating dioxygenase subunit beta, partial [Porticoccaceae bacterium]
MKGDFAETAQSSVPGSSRAHIGDTVETGVRVRASDPTYLDLLEFLWDEAAILDREDLKGWKDMLDKGIRYRMPVCVTRRRGSQEAYESPAMHLEEDFSSLSFRIRRMLETLAWATDPVNRTRRFVTSVRIWRTSDPALFRATSSLLLIRTQDDDYRTDLVTAERFDLIRKLPDSSYRL